VVACPDVAAPALAIALPTADADPGPETADSAEAIAAALTEVAA